MSIAAVLANPEITDRAGVEEYLGNLADLIPTVERGVARLKRAPQDRELIAELFRALHNIKGDAAICQVKLGVLIAHPVETLLGRLRNNEITFSSALAEVVLLAVDTLELAVEAIAAGRPLAQFKLQTLVEHLESLSAGPAEAVETEALHLIEAVTGMPPSARSADPGKPALPAGANDDLRFFQNLALQFEERASWLHGRSGRQLRLALDTNANAGTPVDPVQLEAAIYVHDVGMMFMPESHWLKPGPLSEEDVARIRIHPETGSGILARMPGWQEAARMVMEHQEMPDGKGYPRGLKDDHICAGARILAIVDAFEAIMSRQKAEGQRRSLLRAMTEINASDQQFDPFWIEHFNAVVRKRAE